MLGKLLKYEFKATSKMLLPLYGAVIAFAVINRIFMGSNFNFSQSSGIILLLQVLMLIGYVLIIAAASVGTLVIIIQRFYKNLLKDEGYLMNTLPVSTSSNIWSKLIVAVAWNLICAFVIFLSILILLSNASMINSIGSFYNDFTLVLSQTDFYTQFNGFLLFIEFIVLIVVGSAQSIMMFYASMAIGHLSNNKKILCSFAAFIGLNMVISMASGIVTGILGAKTSLILFSAGDAHLIMLYGCLSSLLITAILFFICNKILRDKLNLE